MQRRTGVTLIEVLVAIFIMGIGLIALLTLFPIGILRMAQAIRDERTAAAAGAAHSLGTMFSIRTDATVGSTPTEPDLFRNPYAAALVDADPFAESFAIYVDPVGYYSGNGSPEWVGGIPGYLRRRPVSYVTDFNSTIRTFKLWDEITFDPNFDPALPGQRPGTPKVIAPTAPLTIQRDPVYSWAYLLRRPQTQDRSVVDCAIVVYDKRATIVMGETVYQNQAYFDPLKNTILLDITPGPTTVVPNIRAGDWLYDATPYRSSYATQLPVTAPNGAHSYFYRVVGTTDVAGAAGKVFARYEVQTPIRGFTSGPSMNSSIGVGKGIADPTGSGSTVYQGTVIVMDRVAEVFEKGPVRLP